MELGRSLLEPLLAADAGYRGPRVPCGAGHQAEFVSYRDKTVDTVLGPVTLRRAWYHCRECGHGLAPRDAELGVAAGTMSPGLAAMTGRAGAALPFTPAGRLVGELAGIPLTGERVRRRAEADGQAAARVIAAGAAAVTAGQVIPITFDPAADFGKLMAAEARRRGAGRIRQLVFLGDGAAWIWNLAARHFPEATQIVDLFHAREHLHDLARLLEFMLADRKQAWLEQRLADLDDGDIPAICAAARVFPLAGKKAADLDTALGYFEHNAHRMRYAHFKSLGMFVGSGAVEAGCKSVVAQRCKLSGMRWTVSGATGILTLRCLQASDRWEEIPALHSQAPAA